MMLRASVLAAVLAATEASLSSIAGYGPGSQVTDHCAIDLDQKLMEEQLAIKTDDSFAAAQKIYEQGGHSKSHAVVKLATPLSAAIAADAEITGKTADGSEVMGKAYDDYEAGADELKVKYATSDIQASYVNCQVGGLPADKVNTAGCLAPTGTLNIAGNDYDYTYDPATDNNAGRTIQGFSTGAKKKMYECGDRCPYTDYKYFYDYYGSHTYADDWVTAALDGTDAGLDNGNADFSKYGMDGRDQGVKKGTVYLNIFMYVIREWEDAIDDCKRDCQDCNGGSVHAWDEGVCFYTGSIEGTDAATDDGKLLHQLADKRCKNFKTCGKDGGETSGMAKLNHDLFELFNKGKAQLDEGKCDEVAETVKAVNKHMYIPFIQGALRYAYKSENGGGETEKAEAATFASGVLPKVHAMDPDAAKIICDNVCVGAESHDFKAVKAAFESVYDKMGITCEDVGGLWNEGTKDYYEGMEPCGTDVKTDAAESGAAAAGLGAAAAALMAVAAL